MPIPAATPEDTQTPAGWQRRHVLKAGVLAAGAGLLGRYAGAAGSSAVSSNEYLAMDATDMARAVQKGELTPEHLLAAAMARCDAVNPKVNAVNMRHDEYARALLQTRRAAGAPATGALAGVPILIKDLNTYLEGTRTTNGCRLFKDAPPAPQTSTLIARYQAAGAVPFGKTACPEFGLTTTTESLLWGQTRNPWNLGRSAGAPPVVRLRQWRPALCRWPMPLTAVARSVFRPPIAVWLASSPPVTVPPAARANMKAGSVPASATWYRAISATWHCFWMSVRVMSQAARTGQSRWYARISKSCAPPPGVCASAWYGIH